MTTQADQRLEVTPAGGRLPTDLAVVIVSWNVRALVQDALRSVLDDLAGSGLDAGVWLVDNASSDGTPDVVRDAFPAVNVIASPRNLGFAAGNNVALRALGFSDSPAPNPGGPHAVLLLNPDTLVQPGALRTLYDALFGLARAGVVGAQLAYGDGAFQHGAFRFPGLLQILIDVYPLPLPGRMRAWLYDSSLNGRYARSRYAAGIPFEVDHTLGATMMLRREVIEQTGMFDEQFFMYVEEIDWSRRIRRAGWSIYVVPRARVTHLEGRSTTQVRPESLVNLWTSRFRFFTKHYPPLRVWLARRLVRGGMQAQIATARRAARRGEIDAARRDALIAAYEKVMRL